MSEKDTSADRSPRRHTVLAPTHLLAVVMLVVACAAGPTRGPVALTEANLVNATTISLGVPSCNGGPEVSRLEETSMQVRIEVASTVHPGGDSCADSIRVQLQSPLGDREVVDLVSGRTLKVSDASK